MDEQTIELKMEAEAIAAAIVERTLRETISYRDDREEWARIEANQREMRERGWKY